MQYCKEPVRAIEVSPHKPISKLLEEMANTGFQGRQLAEAVNVYKQMIEDPEVTILFGYAGSLSTTGQWKIINWLIKQGYIDVLVPTGANVSEDVVEAMGFCYYKSTGNVDDRKLLEENLNRYYDVYGKEDDYMEMTESIAKFYLEELESNVPYSSQEILYKYGKRLKKQNINSIVAIAAENKVPVFCPAIVDSPYGDAVLIAKSKGHKIIIDNAKDYEDFMALGKHVKETGVIYIGGGVPKDFIQLFAVTENLLYQERKVPGRKPKYVREFQSGKETYYPHKYAIQITTDSPQWGGLSGCTFEEAISWGKEDPEGKRVQCYCDATIALPIMAHALAEMCKKRERKIFEHLF